MTENLHLLSETQIAAVIARESAPTHDCPHGKDITRAAAVESLLADRAAGRPMPAPDQSDTISEKDIREKQAAGLGFDARGRAQAIEILIRQAAHDADPANQ